MKTQTFSQISERISAGFLQTVVVLDDQAFFQPKEEPVAGLEEPSLSMAALVDSATRPELPSKVTDEAVKSSDESADPSGVADAVDKDHDLYAKTVIDSFGRKGLVCSVFRPAKDENAPDDYLPALERADLVVLDWVIHKDDGKAALSAIKKLAEGKEKNGRRGLRLIAVYTGQNDLRDIAKRIQEFLVDAGIGSELIDQECTVTANATTICVLAKPEAKVAKDLESRVIEFDQLPSRLIAEFAKSTCGLIPNLLLSALSAVRESTHVLLHQLNKDLDAAFLSHRCLLEQPDDASHLALQLVADEFRSIMDEYGVLNSMSQEVMESWLAEKYPDGLTVSWATNGKSNTYTVTLDQAAKLLANGYSVERNSLNKPKELKNNLTKLFLEHEDNASNSDSHFAMLTSCKTRYKLEEPVPSLTLGTVLSYDEGDATKYLLCILPVCDSVRLTGPRAFPFLPLTVDLSKVYFVARHREEYINLRLNDAPFDCVMKIFKPGKNDKVIKAKLSQETYKFKDESGTEFTWIGELKFAQAQRAVSNFAANLSRVGLDESEWLLQKRKS